MTKRRGIDDESGSEAGRYEEMLSHTEERTVLELLTPYVKQQDVGWALEVMFLKKYCDDALNK